MFKYVWIIILIGVDVIWGIRSINDIVSTIKSFGIDSIAIWDVESFVWFFLNIVILFIASFVSFMCTRG